MTEATLTQEIRHEDCLIGLATLEPGSVDCFVTSPPYNIGKAYGVHNDRMPNRAYLDWQFWSADAVKRVLSEHGSLFLNLGGTVSQAEWPLRILERWLQHFQLQNHCIWVKSLAVDALVRGHYTPINSDAHPYSGFEHVFHLTHSGCVPLDRLAVGVPFADQANLTRGTRGKNGDVHDAGNVWYIPYRTIQRSAEDRPHPASFPVELARRCLLLHGRDRIRLACDPFAGIGSTLLACRELDLPAVGFEIDPAYVATARRLLETPVPAPGRLGEE